MLDKAERNSDSVVPPSDLWWLIRYSRRLRGKSGRHEKVGGGAGQDCKCMCCASVYSPTTSASPAA